MAKVLKDNIFWAATVFALFLLCNAAFAASSLSTIKTALSNFCGDLVNLLPIVSMLMVVFGSVTYAAGQIMGAETRARANVWATSALTGALIAMLITAVTPPMLTTIYGSSVSCQASGTGPSCGASGNGCSAPSDCCSNICNAYSGTCT